jgi:ectoine hydroxylase-related dioxygenase (phytanoyl-CoA dioxygenase family)
MTDTHPDMAPPRWEQLAGTLEPWLVQRRGGPIDDATREDIAAVFDDLGFVVVRDQFGSEEIDELEADLVRVHHALMHGELDARHAAPELQPSQEVVIDGVPFLNYVVYANHASPVADRLIRRSAVAELAPGLLEGETFFYDYDRHGVMYLDARGASAYKGLVWHPDFESTPDLPIWPAVAFTVNLDDTSPENGFLRMLPGSHRTPPVPRPEGYGKVHGEVAVYCQRGDLLLHHSHLWHAASRPSNDDAVRRHIRGKWCSGRPIPAGAWDGTMNNSATEASGR